MLFRSADKQSATTSKDSEATATAPVAESSAPWEDEPAQATQKVEVPKATPSSDKAQDILAMIRARQAKSA